MREVFFCSCGYIPHQIVLTDEEMLDDEVALVAVQIPPMSLRDRLRAIWNILMGYQVSVAEVVLDHPEADRLRGTLDDMIHQFHLAQAGSQKTDGEGPKEA